MRVEERYLLTKGPVRGGTGEVWLAIDQDLGRQVVLKRARTGDEDSAAFGRLRAEARALAQFSHPHVVTLYDAVRAGKRRGATSWLVMEHVRGGSLEDWPPVAPELAARVGTQIAGALAALHGDGIVHCDIKPGNVVVTGDGTAKLADFGAAYRVGGKETITPNGAVSYTPDYAAPEAVRGQPGPASDVFSLGATLYALAAGGPPRPGYGTRAADTDADTDTDAGPDPGPDPDGTLAAAYDRHAAERHAARGAVEMNADIGPLGDVIRAMLHRDPAARPDAAEARARLEALAAEPGALARLALPASALDTAPALDPALASAHDSLRGGGGAGARTGVRPGVRTGMLRRWYGARAFVRHGAPVWQRPFLAGAVALALALTLIPLLSGGDGGERDPGADDDRPSRPAPTATNVSPVIGERRTADPCALTEPAALGRFGGTELDRDYGNFDRCDVLVNVGEENEVDVHIDFDAGLPPELTSPDRSVGKVSVVKEPAESDACGRVLLLSGDPHTTVSVSAKLTESRPAPVCDIADVATDSAVKALNKGELARRSPPLPKASLAHRDVCALFGPRALEIVPGIDASDPDVGFAGWDCDWSSTTSDLWLDVRYDRGQPLSAEDGAPTELHGFRTFVEPEGEGDESCLVRLVYRTYADQRGQKAIEMLYLAIGGSRPADELCRMGTDLAREAAGGLPAAS